MAEKIVIGLFQTAGIAEDACNRLKHEGVPAADIARVVMRETTERPPQMDSEIEALSVDPLLLGNVRESTTFSVGKHAEWKGHLWVELRIAAYRSAK